MSSSACSTSVVLLVLLISFILINREVDGSNVLFLSPITAQNHSNFFKLVVKALADRGHYVTYWNGLKPDNYGGSNNNSRSNNLRLLYSPQLDRFNRDYQVGFQDRHSQRQFKLFFDIPARLAVNCETIYRDPVFHQLMNNSKKPRTKRYDLIVVEGILNDCVLPLVEILDAPFIYMNGIAPTPWLLEAVGSPLALDHFPNPGFSFADEMNLWERTFNTISSLVGLYFRHWFVTPVVDRVAFDFLGGNNLTVAEIERRYLSLLITNTHFSINYQLPTSPAVIQAGGLHCVPPKPLPEELESFVDGSGDAGFIVVSFGSILRGSDLSDGVRRLFLSTFNRLPQRVLWKWEDQTENDDTIPSNVKLLPWMSQQDLLGHPKIRMFITHGGLFSMQEAVYHGVPFVALPVFADQPINAQKAQDDGYAIRIDWDNLTEGILFDAIQRILSDSRYKEKMKQVSSLMRDQMDGPLDRAVYWIEYVIRHRGAPHLRTASRKLWLHQRGLLDVLAVVFVFYIVLGYVVLRLCRCARIIFIHATIKETSMFSNAHNENKQKKTVNHFPSHFPIIKLSI